MDPSGLPPGRMNAIDSLSHAFNYTKMSLFQSSRFTKWMTLGVIVWIELFRIPEIFYRIPLNFFPLLLPTTGSGNPFEAIFRGLKTFFGGAGMRYLSLSLIGVVGLPNVHAVMHT